MSSQRVEALRSVETYSFIDPISLDVMSEPVIAGDGRTYDRNMILAWFATLKREGRPLISPLTRQPLSNENLERNSALLEQMNKWKAARTSSLLEEINFTLSSTFYRELDQVTQLIQMKDLNLKPPKIVVIGNESHGKSTILERIIGLPLFPKAKGICTSCVIRVQLRRCDPGEASIAEISVAERNANPAANGSNVQALTDPYFQARGRSFQQRSSVPVVSGDPEKVSAPVLLRKSFAALENIREQIKAVMEELVRNDSKRRMIIDDREIIVKVRLPYCLNIDLVDVPGMVTTSPPGQSQSFPKVTYQLAKSVVEEEKDTSIFLLVNDIKVPPNQSNGCALIQECHVESQTLGIFTKVDTFVSEDSDEAQEILSMLRGQSSASFPVGYGWMAAASKTAPLGSATASPSTAILSPLKELLAVSEKEREIFQRNYSSLLSSNLLGIDKIRQKVQSIYEQFIKDNWINSIREKLKQKKEVCVNQLQNMGLPLPPDSGYLEFQKESGLTLSVLSKESLATHLQKIIAHLTNPPEEKEKNRNIGVRRHLNFPQHDPYGQMEQNSIMPWIDLNNETSLWNSVNEFRRFIQSDINNSLYDNRYPVMNPLLALAKKKQVLDRITNKLTVIFTILKNKIGNASAAAILSYLNEKSGVFKLSRFDSLMSGLKEMIEQGLSIMAISFEEWFQTSHLPKIQERRMISMQFDCANSYMFNVATTDLSGMADEMIERWFEFYLQTFQLIEHEIERWFEFYLQTFQLIEHEIVPCEKLQENCKAQRLACFQEIIKINNVQQALTQFTSRLTRDSRR